MQRHVYFVLVAFTLACASTDPTHAAPAGPGPSPAGPGPAPTTTPPPGPNTAPTPVRGPAPAPIAPTPQLPEPSYPVGAIGPTCMLRAEIEPAVRADSIAMRFVLVNNSYAPATITLTGACPDGIVRIGGLPEGFDPMHRCQKGACTTPEMTSTFTIPARGKVLLGETTLRAKGDDCNPPLPMGSLWLQALIVSDNPLDACNGSSVHLVRDPRKGTLRLAANGADPETKPAPQRPTPQRPTPQRPAPKPTPAPVVPRKNCPVCAFACLHGIPSSTPRSDGCPSCACEDLQGTMPPKPPLKTPRQPPAKP